jgi:type I restriction enzyme M protein
MPLTHDEVLQRLNAGLPASMKGKDKVRYVLPFLLLARLDAKLDATRQAFRAAVAGGKPKLDDLRSAIPAACVRARSLTQLPYFNVSSYSLGETLDGVGHKARFKDLIEGFSPEVKADLIAMRVLEHTDEIATAGGLLGFLRKLVEVQGEIAALSDSEFGELFLAVLQLLTKATDDNASDCATPRDLADLAADILLANEAADGHALRTVYDPACGTGGLLFGVGQAIFERLGGTVRLRGHEIRPEVASLASLYLLLRISEVSTGVFRATDPPTRIDRANSLTNDGLVATGGFDFAVWNPPMGKAGKWGEPFGADVRAEREAYPSGRYEAGLPGSEDSSLLFLMHALSKLKDTGRAVAFMNASPMFEGEVAETKNSQSIRLWLMDQDWVDAIIALPRNVHFNTDIVTYLWVLDKNKPPERKDKVLLVNAAREGAEGEPVFAELLPKNLNKKRYSVAPFAPSIVGLYRNGSSGGDADVRVVDVAALKFKEVGVARPLQRKFTITSEAIERFVADADVSKALSGKGEGGKAARALRDRLKDMPEGTCDAGEFIDKATAWAWEGAPTRFVKALVATFGLDEDSDEPARKPGGLCVADPSLSDTERIPWADEVEEYLDREVRPYVGTAWAASEPKPGCEINFNRFFYEYKAPRSLDAIALDLQAAREEEDALLDGLILPGRPTATPPANTVPIIQGSLFGPRMFDSPDHAGPGSLPVYDLRAAAGAFSTGQAPEVLGWIVVEGERADRGRFIAQVIGESMNRVVANGDWCLWEHFGAYSVAGAAAGDDVLVRRADTADAEVGEFTFKRLRERGERVVLAPVSTERRFRPLDLQPEDRFVARLVRPLGWVPRGGR